MSTPRSFRFVTLVAIALFGIVLAFAAPGRAQEIDADRPHVGTGTHIVPVGQVQFELGGQYQSFGAGASTQSPALLRFGIARGVEARIATDGWLTATEGGHTAGGMGNVQLGVKLRLIGGPDEPLLSLLPAINIGVASREKGLGSGANDATATLLAGRALGARTHVEANYGVGRIGDPDAGAFTQHLVTAAVIHDIARRLAIYVEDAWWSRQQAGGGAVGFVDYGAIYAISARVLVDGGAFSGVTAATADYGLFAGVSFVIGDPLRPGNRARAARAASAASPTPVRR